MLSQGADLEQVLDTLRVKCTSIIESIKVVREVLAIPLDEAKSMVHYSRAWSDMRDWHSELHEQAENVAREKTTRNPDGSIRVDIDLKKEQ